MSSTKDKNENNFQKNCIKLRFIVSFKFLSTSFDKLVSYLDKEKLHSQNFVNSGRSFDFLTRKGIFSYEYVNCVEKLEDTRLLSRESFFSSLTDDTVSESAHPANICLVERLASTVICT